jgi:hypothetical protein
VLLSVYLPRKQIFATIILGVFVMYTFAFVLFRYAQARKHYYNSAQPAYLPAYLPTCLPAYLPTCLPTNVSAFLPTPRYFPDDDPFGHCSTLGACIQVGWKNTTNVH